MSQTKFRPFLNRLLSFKYNILISLYFFLIFSDANGQEVNNWVTFRSSDDAKTQYIGYEVILFPVLPDGKIDKYYAIYNTKSSEIRNNSKDEKGIVFKGNTRYKIKIKLHYDDNNLDYSYIYKYYSNHKSLNHQTEDVTMPYYSTSSKNYYLGKINKNDKPYLVEMNEYFIVNNSNESNNLFIIKIALVNNKDGILILNSPNIDYTTVKKNKKNITFNDYLEFKFSYSIKSTESPSTYSPENIVIEPKLPNVKLPEVKPNEIKSIKTSTPSNNNTPSNTKVLKAKKTLIEKWSRNSLEDNILNLKILQDLDKDNESKTVLNEYCEKIIYKINKEYEQDKNSKMITEADLYKYSTMFSKVDVLNKKYIQWYSNIKNNDIRVKSKFISNFNEDLLNITRDCNKNLKKARNLINLLNEGYNIHQKGYYPETLKEITKWLNKLKSCIDEPYYTWSSDENTISLINYTDENKIKKAKILITTPYSKLPYKENLKLLEEKLTQSYSKKMDINFNDTSLFIPGCVYQIEITYGNDLQKILTNPKTVEPKPLNIIPTDNLYTVSYGLPPYVLSANFSISKENRSIEFYSSNYLQKWSKKEIVDAIELKYGLESLDNSLLILKFEDSKGASHTFEFNIKSRKKEILLYLLGILIIIITVIIYNRKKLITYLPEDIKALFLKTKASSSSQTELPEKEQLNEDTEDLNTEPDPLPLKNGILTIVESDESDHTPAKVFESQNTVLDGIEKLSFIRPEGEIEIRLNEIWNNNSWIEKVVLTKQFCRKIDAYIQDSLFQGNKTNEVAGFILGKYELNNEERFILYFEQFIDAPSQKSSIYEIEIGSEAFLYLDNEKDKYPDCKVLGWFHTHPGHGIFLSAPDLKIQNNFNSPFQIAMVLDPLDINQPFGIMTWKYQSNINEPMKVLNIEDKYTNVEWPQWTQIMNTLKAKIRNNQFNE